MEYRAYQRKDIDALARKYGFSEEQTLTMRAVSAVLPFRVNGYVLDHLVDWNDVPRDPMFQLTFPQRGMLSEADFTKMADLVRASAPSAEISAAAREVQMRLNPHPSGQLLLNIPRRGSVALDGMQHKYEQTVLFFPSQGQTCHSYCTYCFRWAQFVGLEGMKFASREVDTLVAYLHEHPKVSDVLVTGGDPMIMKTEALRRYIEPLLSPSIEHVASIRIGTKALSFWPHRFVSDPDADDLLRLFERVVASGRQLAFMAHVSHPRELQSEIVREAIRRVRATGAVIRCQAPLARHVNDDAALWAEMWKTQVALGMVPYYMFVERDTGPRNYFEVPLARAYGIFTRAYRATSGLARTVRGPSMSATPGKVVIDGIAEVAGEEVFVLRLLQARDAELVGRPFFAKFDPHATWFDELVPAFGQKSFFSSVRRGDAWAA